MYFDLDYWSYPYNTRLFVRVCRSRCFDLWQHASARTRCEESILRDAFSEIIDIVERRRGSRRFDYEELHDCWRKHVEEMHAIRALFAKNGMSTRDRDDAVERLWATERRVHLCPARLSRNPQLITELEQLLNSSNSLLNCAGYITVDEIDSVLQEHRGIVRHLIVEKDIERAIIELRRHLYLSTERKIRVRKYYGVK